MNNIELVNSSSEYVNLIVLIIKSDVSVPGAVELDSAGFFLCSVCVESDSK